MKDFYRTRSKVDFGGECCRGSIQIHTSACFPNLSTSMRPEVDVDENCQLETPTRVSHTSESKSDHSIECLPTCTSSHSLLQPPSSHPQTQLSRRRSRRNPIPILMKTRHGRHSRYSWPAQLRQLLPRPSIHIDKTIHVPNNEPLRPSPHLCRMQLPMRL